LAVRLGPNAAALAVAALNNAPEDWAKKRA